ncbi:hypothetical protein GA0070617_5794 [Micromonospora yangpuensis]|uniref:CASTOR ACT domain-containing protein n=2 Tax=Micromonosporaceae TaxID=28056 RepID=A0A1C6VGT4_9ACTN|nr:hypothetical protein GA0070617_5794 [Micromonospora yangpuensis]
MELAADGSVPPAEWIALVRAPEGLTVIRPVAAGEKPAEGTWIALYTGDQAHPVDLPGMLSALLVPLAQAGVPVFVASTHHADLVLVPEDRRADALTALHDAGHTVAD